VALYSLGIETHAGASLQRAPLRGREQELAAIGELLGSVRDGRGATLFVEGRAGIGKTRLLHEAAWIAESLRIRVGWGAIDAEDQVVPMSALVAALFDGPRPLADLGTRHGLPYLPEQRYWLLGELEALLERVAPLSRSGTPDDVAEACVALVGLTYSTGQVLVVDGGIGLSR
jgi:AAA ATPase domain/Enoyl-(Acyl carrier protein) reductase